MMTAVMILIMLYEDGNDVEIYGNEEIHNDNDCYKNDVSNTSSDGCDQICY